MIAASLAKEDEFFEVLELSDMLRPEVSSALAKLTRLFDGLDKNADPGALCATLVRAKAVLESGDESGKTEAAAAGSLVQAKQLIAALSSKLSAVLEASRNGASVTSKSLLMLTTRVRQINSLLP